jgi:hypothetical protein
MHLFDDGQSDKLYRVYDPSTRKVSTVRDVVSEETLPRRMVFENDEWKEEGDAFPKSNSSTSN